MSPIILACVACNVTQGILGNDFPSPVVRSYAEDNDIGRAMNICERHSHVPNVVYMEGGTPREYDDGWNACNRVRDEWLRGEEAARIRAEQEQAERDRAFVESVAKELKP